jgi:hypothetical protein
MKGEGQSTEPWLEELEVPDKTLGNWNVYRPN